MSPLSLVIIVVSAGIIGIIFGYFLRWIISLGKRGSVEFEIKQMILSAKEEAQKITEESEKKISIRTEEIKKEAKEKELQYKKTEDRLIKKEELLDRRQVDNDQEVERLKNRSIDLAKKEEELNQDIEKAKTELNRVSGLSSVEAKEELLQLIEKQHKEDFEIRISKLESSDNKKLDRKAKDIIATTIQRIASSVVSEIATTTVDISSDDIKGKVIGKEGRNIRAFERVTGVDVIIDDTPGAIVVSSFDPIRRQIAQVALENLITDGRIQPARIEEFVEKARVDVNSIIKDKGNQAALECGVFNLDPRVSAVLGRLHFRTSYGQNVLQHSIEMAHISGILAEELGADVAVARAGALVHDIGKAIDHEVQGTHVEIGRRILQKFGVDEKIIKAMQSHHEEYPYETIESVIVQIADQISAGRPGARRDTAEKYLKRLEELESISSSFEGVEKSYAIQAGREVRIFVTSNKVSDLGAQKIARKIALRVEQELKYPGEIKIMVLRETRFIEYAR